MERMRNPSKTSGDIFPLISIIIPVHKRGEFFPRCLSSVVEAISPYDQIIVVANGATDHVSNLAESFGAQVIKLPNPVGPARARNAGVQAADNEILFFMDADVTIPGDMIHRIRCRFSGDHELAAVIGSYDDEPYEKNFLSQYKNLFHHYIH